MLGSPGEQSEQQTASNETRGRQNGGGEDRSGRRHRGWNPGLPRRTRGGEGVLSPILQGRGGEKEGAVWPNSPTVKPTLRRERLSWLIAKKELKGNQRDKSHLPRRIRLTNRGISSRDQNSHSIINSKEIGRGEPHPPRRAPVVPEFFPSPRESSEHSAGKGAGHGGDRNHTKRIEKRKKGIALRTRAGKKATRPASTRCFALRGIGRSGNLVDPFRNTRGWRQLGSISNQL